MAHKSFEGTEEIARLLNERFVAIKVDREERPDVDSVYMRICQLMTGRAAGRWIYLSPDPRSRFTRVHIFQRRANSIVPVFVDVLEHLCHRTFANDHEHVEILRENAANICRQNSRRQAKALAGQRFPGHSSSLPAGLIRSRRFRAGTEISDAHMLMYLLRYHHNTGQGERFYTTWRKRWTAWRMAAFTILIGYGFARYSTDNRWLVPHFEKCCTTMLCCWPAYTKPYRSRKTAAIKRFVNQIGPHVHSEEILWRRKLFLCFRRGYRRRRRRKVLRVVKGKRF